MSTPQVALVPALPEHQPLLERLMELYIYDFTEFDPVDVDEEGRYGYPFLPLYWSEPDRCSFLIQVEGRWAGFVLVNQHSLLGQPGIRAIAEFFVLRKYRRQGVGEAAARLTFAHFPGCWEVAEITANLPAQAFWRDVIGKLTGGSFTEVYLETEVWQGPVQTFTYPAVNTIPREEECAP
jgi:predicted acetyltransferase